MRLEKKLITLGLVGIMGLAQCTLAYAVTPGFSVTKIAYNIAPNNNGGLATGGTSYIGGGSISWAMQDTVTIDCYVSGETYTYTNSGFGTNAASATCSQIYYPPTSGRNEGFRKVNYTYQSIGYTLREW